MSGCLDAQYVPGQFFGVPPNLRGICSHQGFCNVSSNRCVCVDGWTGLSDFFGDPGTDCHINILGIQVEYGLLLLFTLLSVLFSYSPLLRRWQVFTEAKLAAKRSNRVHKLSKDKGLLSSLLWYAFGIPSLMLVCILRMASTKERIGVTALITCFAGITKVAYNASIVVYQPFLFSALIKVESLERMMQSGANRFIRFVRISASFGAVLGVASAFVPFVSIWNPSLAPIVVTVYFGLSGVSLLYDGVIAYFAYQQAEKVFVDLHTSHVDPSPAIKKFRDRTLLQLKLYQYGLNITSTIIGLFFLMACVWSFWWSLHDYFLPFTLLPILKVGYDLGVGSREPLKNSTRKKSVIITSVDDQL